MKGFFKKIFGDDEEQKNVKTIEKDKVQEEKSLGPMLFLYRKKKYRVIGQKPADFTEENLANTDLQVLD